MNAKNESAAKVLVADKLDPAAVAWLEDEARLDVTVNTGRGEDELCADIANYDAVIVRSATRITPRVIAAATRLRVVGRAGIGVDNIDLPAATERGIAVLNTPDANATTTAELTVAHLLSLSRNLPQADRSVREGRWERAALTGTEVAGKALGLLGYGTIGRLVAARATGLKMKVLVHDPFVGDDVVRGDGYEPVDQEALLARADYVTLHCPVTDRTRGLIDAAALAAMKPGARLINCARGALVVEQALADALASGRLAGAAVDVFAQEPPEGSPLLTAPNIVFTPHLGASTHEAQTAVGDQIVRQIAEFLATGEPVNAVNLPSIPSAQLAVVRPYMDLARRLGRVVGALAEGALETLEITLHDDDERIDVGLLAVEAAAGLLSGSLDGPVNRVNAAHLAKRQGLKLVQSRAARGGDYATRVDVTGRGPAGVTTVAGTLFDGRFPRLVRIGGFEIEAVLEGELLLTRHADQPGVLAGFSAVLAAAGLNIARLHLGPVGREGRAMAVIGLEQAAPPETVRAIADLPPVEAVFRLSLGGA